jgi:hypothetical protein
MKRWLAAVAIILPITAGAYTTGTPFPTIVVDNSPGAQMQQHVSGNYAAYTIVPSSDANVVGPESG